MWRLGNEGLIRSGITRIRIGRQHRRRLKQCFVHPRHYGQAAERLEPPGSVVLLGGAAGSGRRAAATMLLDRAAVAGSRFEELPLTWEEDSLEAAANDCYLLDLSSVTDADYPKAQRALAQYRSVVEQCGARMVAVLPAGLDWMLDSDLSALRVGLGRPDGRAVFRRHLLVKRVAFGDDDLKTAILTRMFAGSPMEELERLADLVAQARDSHAYGDDFPAWIEVATAAVTNWSDQVAKQLRDHRDGTDRALLLTAAMVSGAAGEAVLSGANSLLELLQHEPDDTPRLSQADLGEQFERLDIDRGDDGRVGFTRLAYDGAVRRHFWQNFPDLRPAFRDWAGQCMELPELRGDDRMQLVARFAELALATGRPDDLCSLVERWTRPSAAGRLRAEAAAALELGLSHDRYGALIRSRMYDWAAVRRPAPDLVRVLTDVCHQVMAATHPDQALVRLRHLALRHPGAEGAAARAALLDLARGSGKLFRRLVDALLGLGPRHEAALNLLLDLLEPAALRVLPPWQAVTFAWRAVMSERPAPMWTPLVWRWLTALARSPERDRMLGVLVVAACGDDVLLNDLYVAACQWSAAVPRTPDQYGTAEELCHKIDLLQGIDGAGTTPGTRPTREES
ncbi:hypothetical protein [Streptomyces sp. NPDC047315]|uniref:hypothetical protein n=1 Tax=Streptomyces sp. NPDC047315 TaxID=3155142 RepID=UPI003406E733